MIDTLNNIGVFLHHHHPPTLLLPRSLTLLPSPPPPPPPTPTHTHTHTPLPVNYPYASAYIQQAIHRHAKNVSEKVLNSTWKLGQTGRFRDEMWTGTMSVHFWDWPAVSSKEMAPWNYMTNKLSLISTKPKTRLHHWQPFQDLNSSVCTDTRLQQL